MSLFLFTDALSSGVGEAITSALIDPHLIWYVCLSVVSSLSVLRAMSKSSTSSCPRNSGQSVTNRLINRVWAGPAIVLFVLTIEFHYTYRHLNNDEFYGEAE